jgi:hypothetical protein
VLPLMTPRKTFFHVFPRRRSRPSRQVPIRRFGPAKPTAFSVFLDP